jgi:hypothetical protein
MTPWQSSQQQSQRTQQSQHTQAHAKTSTCRAFFFTYVYMRTQHTQVYTCAHTYTDGRFDRFACERAIPVFPSAYGVPPVQAVPSVSSVSHVPFPEAIDAAPIAAERWLTWKEWQAEQANRIFAQAHAARKVPSGTAEHSRKPDNVSLFQFLFFDQLRTLPADSEQQFLEAGRQAGIPLEARLAYWREVKCAKKAG